MSYLKSVLSQVARNPTKTVRSLFWISGLFAGLMQAIAARGVLYPDGISYLNVAEAYVRDGWRSSINSYWSPLYSWLIAIPNLLHLSNLSNELFILHQLNFLIFILTMASFEFFLSSCLGPSPKDPSLLAHTSWASVLPRCVAYLVFLCLILKWLPNALTMPDLLAAFFSFLAAAFLIKLNSGIRPLSNSLGFGVSLAFGYLAKAALFPYAIFSLAVLFIARRRAPRGKASFLLAPIAFLIVAAPFLVSVSAKEGKLTFGESGRVNYLIYVNRYPFYWIGEDIGGPAETRGFHRTETSPVVFTFTHPAPGIYLPTNNPSRWYQEVRPRFHLKDQLMVMPETSLVLGGMFGRYGEIAAAVLAIILLCRRERRLAVLQNSWVLTVPALCMFALYSLVHIEERFLAGFMVIFWVGLLLSAVNECRTRMRTVRPILFALLVILFISFAWGTARQTMNALLIRPSSSSAVLESLESVGLGIHSKVGVLGTVFSLYELRTGQFSVVAAIPPSSEADYFAASGEKLARTDQVLLEAGAQALIVQSESPVTQPGWIHAPSTNLYVKLLATTEKRPSCSKPYAKTGKGASGQFMLERAAGNTVHISDKHRHACAYPGALFLFFAIRQ
jgi:hypothetical protein